MNMSSTHRVTSELECLRAGGHVWFQARIAQFRYQSTEPAPYLQLKRCIRCGHQEIEQVEELPVAPSSLPKPKALPKGKCLLCDQGYDGINDKHWVGGELWQCTDPPTVECYNGCGHRQHFSSSQDPCANCGKTWEDKVGVRR